MVRRSLNLGPDALAFIRAMRKTKLQWITISQIVKEATGLEASADVLRLHVRRVRRATAGAEPRGAFSGEELQRLVDSARGAWFRQLARSERRQRKPSAPRVAASEPPAEAPEPVTGGEAQRPFVGPPKSLAARNEDRPKFVFDERGTRDLVSATLFEEARLTCDERIAIE